MLYDISEDIDISKTGGLHEWMSELFFISDTFLV